MTLAATDLPRISTLRLLKPDEIPEVRERARHAYYADPDAWRAVHGVGLGIYLALLDELATRRGRAGGGAA